MPDTANPIVELPGVTKRFELQGERIDALARASARDRKASSSA